jgi:hypothetical protein
LWGGWFAFEPIMIRFPVIAAFVIGGLLGATAAGISASKFASPVSSTSSPCFTATWLQVENCDPPAP